jgi:hypothetical protein
LCSICSPIIAAVAARERCRPGHREGPSGNQGICNGCSWAIYYDLPATTTTTIPYGLAILNKKKKIRVHPKKQCFFFGNAMSALPSPDGGRQWPNDGEEEGPLCCVRWRWRWKGGGRSGRGEKERRRFRGVPRQGVRLGG